MLATCPQLLCIHTPIRSQTRDLLIPGPMPCQLCHHQRNSRGVIFLLYRQILTIWKYESWGYIEHPFVTAVIRRFVSEFGLSICLYIHMFICACNQVKPFPTDWQSTCSCWCICCSWEVSSTSTSATRIQWGRARTQVQGSVRSRRWQRRIRLIGRTGSTDVRQPRELSRLVRVQLPGTGSTRWASNVRCEFCYDLWYWHCSVVCSQWIKLLKSTVILHTFSLKANIKLNLSHFLNKFLCILWWYLVIFGLHTHTPV